MRTTIYLATARGLPVITGADESWYGAVCLEGKQIQCVAADLKRKGVVYCGTFGDGMFRSDDGGVTWKASCGFTKPNVTALTPVQFTRGRSRARYFDPTIVAKPGMNGPHC